MRRAASGRIMGSRRKPLSRTTSKTLQAVEEAVTNRRIRIHQRLPRATAAAEVGEDSPVFLAFRVNSPTFSVVLGSEEETALEMHLPYLVPMPRRTHLLSRHTATGHISLFRQSPVQRNFRPTHRPTRHPTHRAILNHLREVINLLTVNLPPSSGLAVGPGDTVTLGVALGLAGPRSHNHKPTE